MKIGIISFTNTLNYGASLQAYAMQELLRKNDNNVEIIKYTSDIIEAKEKNIKKNNIKSLYKEIIMGRGIRNKSEKFETFENKRICFGMELNEDTKKEVNNNYDLFITGSDQVWNPQITNYDWTYFLNFVNDKEKKISYAPSFGKGSFSDREKEKAKNYLQEFKAVSVREVAGKKLIKKISNIDAEVVLDPTLLLNKVDWESRIKFKPNIDHYILVYLPHNKKKVFNFVKKLKRKTGLPIIYLSISPRIQFGVKTIYDASPDEFLGWINNADYVVTGSFHGTAFSINLNKQFFYEPTGEGSRIDNLVKITGTEERSIYNENVINERIDYAIIEERLNKERKKSIKWIKKAIQNR